ncbi:hypothetical protein ZHAS_00019470 [Anopheles sinensis]|uniref:Uncharacterized protein n=1 Tax=Anopheles sinensis TaxID=74873 RepID=A0A084WLW2_ANOSI|nr:hypothetical protein ZHAS_00019470 [Anopheles sinensis]
MQHAGVRWRKSQFQEESFKTALLFGRFASAAVTPKGQSTPDTEPEGRRARSADHLLLRGQLHQLRLRMRMEVLLRVSSAHSDAMLCEGCRWRTALKGSPGPGMAVTLVATASVMLSGTPTVASAREVEMTGPDDPPCHQMRRRRSPRQPPLGASPVPWSPGKVVKEPRAERPLWQQYERFHQQRVRRKFAPTIDRYLHQAVHVVLLVSTCRRRQLPSTAYPASKSQRAHITGLGTTPCT